MAALTLSSRLIGRFLADLARLNLGGGFRAGGVTIQHPDVLLDQERAGEVVARAVAALSRRGHRPRALSDLLARVDVRVLPHRGPGRPRVDVEARWTGGFRDRGLICIRHSPDWPDQLGRALLALLLLELEPNTRPEDVVLGVTEEADA